VTIRSTTFPSTTTAPLPGGTATPPLPGNTSSVTPVVSEFTDGKLVTVFGVLFVTGACGWVVIVVVVVVVDSSGVDPVEDRDGTVVVVAVEALLAGIVVEVVEECLCGIVVDVVDVVDELSGGTMTDWVLTVATAPGPAEFTARTPTW
jgi:hypothetical protein